MGEDGLSIADAMALANGNHNNGDFFGGNSTWVLFLFFLMAWGNGGWFGNRGNNNGLSSALLADRYATSEEVQNGFYHNSTTNDLNSIIQGICDSRYENAQLQNAANIASLQELNAMNFSNLQGLNNLQVSNMNGFNSVNQGICNLGYTQQNAVMENRLLGAQNTDQIVNAINNMGQKIIDNQNQTELDNLRTELATAKLALENNEQTAQLISTLRPFPQPSYITCSPYTSASSCSGCSAYYGA